MKFHKTPFIDAAPGDVDDTLSLDRQMCFALYAASNLLMGRYRPVLAPLGLTFPQYLVMLVLWESTPQSVNSLGKKLYLDSGTLTPLLKRMEVAGLVTRQRDASDERRVLVALTEQGQALRTPAREAITTLGSNLSLSLPETEAIALRDGARNLISSLTDDL